MRTPFFRLFLSALCVAACADHDINESFDGNYSGTFYRVTNGVKGPVSNVTLSFSNNQFSGTSSSPKYPAICRGTFTQTTQSMTFSNACFWTAEFDWSLILNSEFKATRKDDEFVLAKEYNADNGDYYILKRVASTQ